MKTKILILLLCVACSASFAQTRRKRNTGKKKPPTQIVDTTKNSAVQSQRPALRDTTKKLVGKNGKPFDRPLDGYYKKTNILSAKVLPYPNLRESDVAYAKRVWREIDVREKMNNYLVSPKQRLIDVLLNAIAAGELTAFDPTQSK